MGVIDRRRFLYRIAGGAALLAGARVSWPARAAGGEEAPAGKLQRLARLFREAPRERVQSVGLEEMRRGAGAGDLLGAIFLAGVHDIYPRPVGFKLHAVLMVSSAWELARGAAPEDRLFPVLFNLDYLKEAQGQDPEDDWVLPDPPRAEFANAAQASEALRRALEEWDDVGADRAASWLAPRIDLEGMFALLWPYGGRCYMDVGHKVIYCAQAYRAIKMIGWEHGLPAVRSLILGLLRGGPGEDSAPFAHNRSAAAALAGTAAGKPDADASLDVLRRLRACNWREASDLVLELRRRGVAAESVWDGVRLAASEMLLRHPSLLPVHPVTAANAFHHAYRSAAGEATRDLLLLQAASWMPLFREEMLRRVRGFTMDGPGLDALQPEDGVGAPITPARGLAAAATPEGAARVLRAARRRVARKGDEAHHFKYAAAAFEDQGLSDPRWAPRILAAGLAYLPSEEAPDSDIYRRSRDAVRGVPA